MQLTTEDRLLIGDSIRQVCQDLSAHCFARPEQTCTPAAFEDATRLLVAQGLVNLGDEAGCGLWEDAGDAGNLALTLDSLATLAASNPALALSLHRSALARHLLGCLPGTPDPAPDAARLTLCLHGRHGLGRGELALWWQGRLADEALLSDVLDAGSPRLALMQRNTGGVLCPVFADGELHWWLCPPGPAGHDNHGLDELDYGQVSASQGVLLGAPAGAAGRALARDIWHREWLGLLAIQLGGVRRAYARARDYSALRYQGGQIIDRHPAVQALLADIRGALVDAGGFLGMQALDTAGFGRLLLSRNRLQEGLSVAANAAMQIFGGIGYMRDTGMEKAFRDVNQLRYQSGGPLDMQLLAAHWEDAA